MSDSPHLDKRCGSCARFVRVVEKIDENGEVKRHGECLLMVWPAPLYDTNTCNQYVKRGTFTAKPQQKTRVTRSPSPQRSWSSAAYPAPRGDLSFTLPEELLDMDKDEFREVLRAVIRDELGVGDAGIGQRWEGGEVILKPGKEGTQEKRIPIDALFNKIVMIRDKLRVLEQKINANPKLTSEEKVSMQQYITGCYGSLTTFNVLFADKRDQFVGARGGDD